MTRKESIGQKNAVPKRLISRAVARTLTGLGEEGVESVITPTDGLVRGHLPVGLDAMLQAVELPARVTFAESDGHKNKKREKKGRQNRV